MIGRCQNGVRVMHVALIAPPTVTSPAVLIRPHLKCVSKRSVKLMSDMAIVVLATYCVEKGGW